MPKQLELRFPFAGVVRRMGLEGATGVRSAYPTPWAVNVRPVDPFDRRMRGGSRPGLTKYHADAVGTTVVDMVTVPVSSDSGAEALLVLLVDNSIGVIDSGVLSFLTGDLATEAGDKVVTEAGGQIVVSTADAPAGAFLIAGQQHVYAVAAAAIVRCDPKTGTTTTITASAGTVPTGQTFGCLYRDRLVVSGEDNAIYMSRQGDYSDWDYGADVEDAGRAVAFQLAGAGEVGDACTAVIPYADAALLAATARGLWVARGDPAANGSLINVSRHVGIVDSRAFCEVDGTVFFLAEDGLYRVKADGSDLTNLADERIPDELRSIDTGTTTVLLGYDHDAVGVHLYLVTAGGSDTHWFFDFRTSSFWPMRLDDDHAPVAVCEHAGSLLLAGSDGYVRSTTGDDDDDEDIESHLLIGPLRLGGAGDFGMIQNLHGVLGQDSGSVAWRLVVGDSAEQAADSAKAAVALFQAGSDYSAYVYADGTWAAGRSLPDYPRIRAMWAVLWLQSTAQWAYESILLETVPFGRWR